MPKKKLNKNRMNCGIYYINSNNKDLAGTRKITKHILTRKIHYQLNYNHFYITPAKLLIATHHA